MYCSNITKIVRQRDSLDYHERDNNRNSGYHKQAATIPCKAQRATISNRRKMANINRERHLRREQQGYNWCDYRHRGCSMKSVYQTELDAIRAAIAISRDTKPLRPYRCEYCGKWHLSSKAARSEDTEACTLKEAV